MKRREEGTTKPAPNPPKNPPINDHSGNITGKIEPIC